MRAFIEGIGIAGPGLNGWQESRPVLAGNALYRTQPTVLAVPGDLLPPAERRRTSIPVKLALAAGHEAVTQSGRDASMMSTVFTSSCGDGETLHSICAALLHPDREVSPTRFHNSVHNAPAGYWGIATHSHEASTSLCCYDASFAAGLLEAMVQVTVDRKLIILVAYDFPYPEPLRAVRTIGAEFSVALVLVPEATPQALGSVEVDFLSGNANPSRMQNTELEALRATTPPARGLPLLAALARGNAETVMLEYVPDSHLRAEVKPCR